VGIITTVKHGGREYYAVRGQNGGGFTNLDAAEAAARKLHPEVLKPKPAPAGGLKVPR
jgi:hypothetical protein